ncbi:MAG: CvpA family protein [OM182 bacterium]|uniref:CvpA family protein n=1 Tax=OM182 bacterium TaxID=2510334 RepID=A0A520S0U4_9GAMM|nr:MAG: CvpA family protein [OM182 bacterium]
MGFADWLILGVIAVSTLLSISKGFLREALSLGILIVAVVVARIFGPNLSVLLVDFIEITSLRVGLAYAFMFFGTLVVGGLINRLLARVIKISGLGEIDRFLGIFFGLARGGLIVLVFVAICHYLVPVQNDVWWKESVLIPHFISVVEWLGPILWEQGEQIFEETDGRVT